MKINSDGGLYSKNNRKNNQLKPLQDGTYRECNMLQHVQSKMISNQMEWMYKNILNKQKIK
jgi:hypothetical protein